MFNLNLIYKFPFLSKNNYLLNLSIRNIFDALPDLKFVIEKRQNPLSRYYFFHINTQDLIEKTKIVHETSLNLTGIFDIENINESHSITGDIPKIKNKTKLNSLVTII